MTPTCKLGKIFSTFDFSNQWEDGKIYCWNNKISKDSVIIFITCSWNQKTSRDWEAIGLYLSQLKNKKPSATAPTKISKLPYRKVSYLLLELFKNKHWHHQKTDIGKGVEEREPSYVAGGNGNWCSYCVEYYGGSLKKLKVELPYDPATPLLGIFPEKTLIWKDTYILMLTAAHYSSQDMEAT